MVDEFRSHTCLEDKMSFICADGESGNLVDILPTRRLDKLTLHFSNFPKKEREQVDFILLNI